MAAGKAAVTPRIQALADEITAGISDRRDQAHRIYDWVSKHIRYVAVFLGNGGYEPHEAIKILENGYGDCKDHVVLLEALLKAKGIASLPVLIDSGNRYRAPETATPAAFNHVISFLPEFDLYVDSTAGVAPFGILPVTEYGKRVALATEPGGSLTMLPLVVAEDDEEKLQTTAQLMADGTVSGKSTTGASGPFGIKLRGLAASVEVGGPERWAQSYFKSLGWRGKASFQFDPPRDRLAPDYAFSALARSADRCPGPSPSRAASPHKPAGSANPPVRLLTIPLARKRADRPDAAPPAGAPSRERLPPLRR